jgi:hypothetical protein
MPQGLDRSIRLLVVGVLVVNLVVPLVLTIGIMGGHGYVSGTIFGLIGDVWDRATANGITTGVDPTAFKEIDKRLRSLSAYEGEAKGAAKSLQVVVVRFPEGLDGEGNETSLAREPDGFTSVDLNLLVQGTATLLIADAPIRWRVKDAPELGRALLAVESPMAFDLVGARKGLLAGYRVAGHTRADVTRPRDIVEGANVERFCSAIRAWRNHFNLDRQDVWLTAVDRPTEVTITDQRVYHTGREVNGIRPLSDICGSW